MQQAEIIFLTAVYSQVKIELFKSYCHGLDRTMLFMSHELHSIVRCASSCLDIGTLHTTVQAFETATINDLSSLKILSCMRLHDIYLMHSFLPPPPPPPKKSETHCYK